MVSRIYLGLAVAVCLGCLLLALAGCSKHYTKIALHGTSDLNGGGNPLVVRLYQLKTDENFKTATFDIFWQKEDADLEYLAGDLVANSRKEEILHPEQTIPVTLTLSNETNFIGIAANFFASDNIPWNKVLQVSRFKGKTVSFELNKNSLLLKQK